MPKYKQFQFRGKSHVGQTDRWPLYRTPWTVRCGLWYVLAQKITMRTFPNHKPWVDKSIRNILRSCSAAYDTRRATGNMDEYKSASCKSVKKAKLRYRRKLESQLNTFYARLDNAAESAFNTYHTLFWYILYFICCTLYIVYFISIFSYY